MLAACALAAPGTAAPPSNSLAWSSRWSGGSGSMRGERGRAAMTCHGNQRPTCHSHSRTWGGCGAYSPHIHPKFRGRVWSCLVQPELARKTWRTLEPIHGAIYFAPEAENEYREVGLDPHPMSY